VVLAGNLRAQDFRQRGFVESDVALYSQNAPNDSANAVSEERLRYEASYRPLAWLRFAGSLDASFDTHQQVDRTLRLDWQDRSLQRPAFSLREFNATISRGRFTFDAGRQFIRWGKADLLNPTDRFAPKDFLTVTDAQFLAVTAARLIYDTGTDSFDLVWQPLFSPSRTPLVNERWTVLPAAFAGVPITDLGSRIPGRSSFGARWNHTGSGYEVSASFFDGFNHLPLIRGFAKPPALDIQRTYPALRLYGADAAVPLNWFTVKTEAAYYTSPDRSQDQYLIYVVQLERQIRELSIIAGYAGSVITERVPGFQFSPDLGFARAILVHVQYTVDSERSVSLDTATRQNGAGSWARAEFSQGFGQHWRVTAGFTWIRGDAADFLGQYHRNSFGLLALRYSF
jgi:hypothetical protein